MTTATSTVTCDRSDHDHDSLEAARECAATSKHPGVETTPHIDGCPKPGFRYAATIRRTKASIANGRAGMVMLVCKNAHCGSRRYA